MLKKVQWKKIKLVTNAFKLILILSLRPAKDLRPEILPFSCPGALQEPRGSPVSAPHVPKASSWSPSGVLFCNTSALYEKF